jgi:hypothetical protein
LFLHLAHLRLAIGMRQLLRAYVWPELGSSLELQGSGTGR